MRARSCGPGSTVRSRSSISPWLDELDRRRKKATAGEKKAFRSLKVSDAFRSFVINQLEELGDVTPRPMFGGVGLYHRGVFFAIMAGDVLYLKVGDWNRADYMTPG